jgi:hypothetical protein
MKRVGFLWEDLISFPNLLHAAYRAQRGKRFRPATARFHYHLEQELWTLHGELKDRTYRPGPYRTFKIHEPKERIISAAPYRDRVVHHALCNLLEPIFERRFLPDSYACRQGKGRTPPSLACQGEQQTGQVGHGLEIEAAAAGQADEAMTAVAGVHWFGSLCGRV